MTPTEHHNPIILITVNKSHLRREIALQVAKPIIINNY